jgi:hypothetical protein
MYEVGTSPALLDDELPELRQVHASVLPLYPDGSGVSES